MTNNNLNCKYNSLLTSGFKKSFVQMNEFFSRTAFQWMKMKRDQDGIWPYWRIHNGLYDFETFMHQHPGGSSWIVDTKGTDITEAFETSHFSDVPKNILDKYFVKVTDVPRASPFTFEADGFYKKLKEKAAPILLQHRNKHSWKFKVIQDTLFVLFLTTFISGGVFNSYFSMMVSGFFLSLSINAAHNFFHQKDNWRMHIFDFSMLSSRNWRISHCLSHHLFPNTIIDFELLMAEPYVSYIPRKDKSLISFCVIMIGFPLWAGLSLMIDFMRKLIQILSGQEMLTLNVHILFMEFLMLAVLTSTKNAIIYWFLLHFTANIVFVTIGVGVGHYHQQTYIELDRSLEDKDWGLQQIAATHDRSARSWDSLFLTAISYGDHTLHHLFPTIDHSQLPLIKDVFLETCREFGVEYNTNSWNDHMVQVFVQTARTKPRLTLPKSVSNYQKPNITEVS